MEHPDEKPTLPESPNTHKRIMARNRMRRYRLRQKQSQQARNQAGTMIFTLPPQSPIVYHEMMQGHTVPPQPMYQPPPIEGYEAPLMPSHTNHMTPQMTPPQMHPVAANSAQVQPAPAASSQLNHFRQFPYSHHQPQPHQTGGVLASNRSSSPSNAGTQGLMPPMPPMPPQQRPDSEATLQALQQALDSLSINVSRPINTAAAVQDILHALPMRSDSAEAIEFAARICKILGLHLS